MPDIAEISVPPDAPAGKQSGECIFRTGPAYRLAVRLLKLHKGCNGVLDKPSARTLMICASAIRSEERRITELCSDEIEKLGGDGVLSYEHKGGDYRLAHPNTPFAVRMVGLAERFDHLESALDAAWLCGRITISFRAELSFKYENRIYSAVSRIRQHLIAQESL
ncbi:hypothetical protein [Sutterella sp.]|uniref:hypothetical protein n=1 Tax=Sutterella sp. TaxID=1981025 RepID=UPI003FD8F0DF